MELEVMFIISENKTMREMEKNSCLSGKIFSEITQW